MYLWNFLIFKWGGVGWGGVIFIEKGWGYWLESLK